MLYCTETDLFNPPMVILFRQRLWAPEWKLGISPTLPLPRNRTEYSKLKFRQAKVQENRAHSPSPPRIARLTTAARTLRGPLKAGSKALSEGRNRTEFPPNESLTSSKSSHIFSPVFNKQLFSSLKFLLPCQQPTLGCPPPSLLKGLGSPPWPQICPTCFYSGLSHSPELWSDCSKTEHCSILLRPRPKCPLL